MGPASNDARRYEVPAKIPHGAPKRVGVWSGNDAGRTQLREQRVEVSHQTGHG